MKASPRSSVAGPPSPLLSPPLLVAAPHRPDDLIEKEIAFQTHAEPVNPPEWLSLLHDKLARIVAKILDARETSKSEKEDLDVSGPAA